MPGRVYPSARDRILDAAERLILARGIGQLSIEAVAAEAKISKGGFFHHFAAKDELLLAILNRLIERVNGEIALAAARDPEPRGARLRAQIALAFDQDPAVEARFRALILAFLEAASAQPAVLRRAREVNAEALARDMVEDIPIGRAIAIQLALDGYGLSQALGSMALSPAQRAAFKDSLMALAQPEANPKARSVKARSPKKGM